MPRPGKSRVVTKSTSARSDPLSAERALNDAILRAPSATLQNALLQHRSGALAKALEHADRLKAAVGLPQIKEMVAAQKRAMELVAPHLRKIEVSSTSTRDAGRETSIDGSTNNPPSQTAPPSVIATSGDLGQLVRQMREQRKMSQQDFADLAGVGRRFLSELENGKTTLEFDKVLRVAGAAGIDLVAMPRQ